MKKSIIFVKTLKFIDMNKHDKSVIELWHRCNFKEIDGHLYYCYGNHNRNQSCDWIMLGIEDFENIIRIAYNLINEK